MFLYHTADSYQETCQIKLKGKLFRLFTECSAYQFYDEVRYELNFKETFGLLEIFRLVRFLDNSYQFNFDLIYLVFLLCMC